MIIMLIFLTMTEVRRTSSSSITMTEVAEVMMISHHPYHYLLKVCHFTMEMVVLTSEAIRIAIMTKVDTSMIEAAITMDIKAIHLLILMVGIIVIRMTETGIIMAETIIMHTIMVAVTIGMLLMIESAGWTTIQGIR